MNINLNNNEWDDRRKAFEQSEEGKRIADKYRAKTYEERNEHIRNFARWSSYVFHGISIMTGASAAFGLIVSLLSDVELPVIVEFILAAIVSLSALVLLEVGQRHFSQPFFEKLVLKRLKREHIGLVMMLLLLSSTSLYLSVDGSFVLPKLSSNKVAYVVPELESIDEVKAHYESQIEKARSDAKRFYNSKLYGGKISDANTVRWNELKQVEIDLTKEMNNRIAFVQSQNLSKERQAKLEHNAKVASQEKENEKTGWGLAGVALFSITLFYLCIWYCEKYDYEVAKQYATVGNNKTQQPTINSQQHANNTPTTTINKLRQQPTTPVVATVATVANKYKSSRAKTVEDLRKRSEFNSDSAYSDYLLDQRKKQTKTLPVYHKRVDDGTGNVQSYLQKIADMELIIKEIDKRLKELAK